MKDNTDISKVLKSITAVLSVLAMIVILVSCAGASKEKANNGNDTSVTTSRDMTSEQETSSIRDDATTGEVDSSERETTSIVSDSELTSEQMTTTEEATTTTSKPKETTTKNPGTHVIKTTASKTTTAAQQTTTSQQETTTRMEAVTRPVETHPVDPEWFEEETTTKDYSENETVVDDNMDDVLSELVPVYIEQLKDEIRYRTSHIRNWLNYSISEYNTVYNAELTYLLMEYFETHNPHVFDLILVDNLKTENWKRICAAEIYGRNYDMFDWKCITEYHNIYNNLLWDCLYNEDFDDISNIEFLPIPEDQNERIFEDRENVDVYYDLKISFKSGGKNYIAWFETLCFGYEILDIDRLN